MAPHPGVRRHPPIPVLVVGSFLRLREEAFAGVAIVVAVGPIRTDRIWLLDSKEVDAPEVDAYEIGAVGIGAAEIGAVEVGAPEVGVLEVEPIGHTGTTQRHLVISGQQEDHGRIDHSMGAARSDKFECLSCCLDRREELLHPWIESITPNRDRCAMRTVECNDGLRAWRGTSMTFDTEVIVEKQVPCADGASILGQLRALFGCQ
jgi:hypothetical protein